MKRKVLLVKDLVGILKHTSEESKEFKKRVSEFREAFDKGFDERIKDVRTRFKNTNISASDDKSTKSL